MCPLINVLKIAKLWASTVDLKNQFQIKLVDRKNDLAVAERCVGIGGTYATVETLYQCLDNRDKNPLDNEDICLVWFDKGLSGCAFSFFLYWGHDQCIVAFHHWYHSHIHLWV